MRTAFFGVPAMPFTLGQVLVADSQDGMIFVYSPTGTLLQVLNANVPNPSNTTVLNTAALLRGMAFDAKGNLYAANLDGASVVTFPSTGTTPTFLGNNPAPYSVVIDPVGVHNCGTTIPSRRHFAGICPGRHWSTDVFFLSQYYTKPLTTRPTGLNCYRMAKPSFTRWAARL